MAYLNFLLERVNAPLPRFVALVAPKQDWIRTQIVDEILDEWPGCSVKLVNPEEEYDADMLVVPFEGKSLENITFPFKKLSSLWVILYGLERRRIWILSRKEALALIRKARLLRKLRSFMSNARIVRPIKWGIQLWKRLACT